MDGFIVTHQKGPTVSQAASPLSIHAVLIILQVAAAYGFGESI